MKRNQRRWLWTSIAAGCGVLAAVLSATAPASANPLPDGAIFTHVQAHDPGFCANHGITSCEQIQQITTEDGLLEFGLFHQPVAYYPEPASQISFELHWPQTWDFHEITVCCGDYTFEMTTHGIQVDVNVDPAYQLDEFFLIAHVALEVTTAGRLEIPQASAGEGGFLFLDGIPGTAGVPCGDCTKPCDYSETCLAHTDVQYLEMTVPEGGLAEAQFHGWAIGMNPLCDIAFSTPTAFLSLEVEEGQSGYDVTVLADGTGLQPGEHFGYVVAYTNLPCEMCVPVYLTVTPGTPVSRETWGAIKGQYR